MPGSQRYILIIPKSGVSISVITNQSGDRTARAMETAIDTLLERIAAREAAADDGQPRQDKTSAILTRGDSIPQLNHVEFDPQLASVSESGARMKLFAGAITASLAVAAVAATPYRMHGVTLLQPEFVLNERVASIGALSGYIKAVQVSAEKALSGTTVTPATGYLVLAVRPGGRSMVWFDFKPALPEPTASRLRAAILEVPAFEAKEGAVVFALNSSLWGAPAPTGFPSPPEWNSAMQGHAEPLEIGALVDKVWPDGTSN